METEDLRFRKGDPHNERTKRSAVRFQADRCGNPADSGPNHGVHLPRLCIDDRRRPEPAEFVPADRVDRPVDTPRDFPVRFRSP
jgi:hypothetical protein